jgi:predicted GNAT superfamily acetyltransferase
VEPIGIRELTSPAELQACVALQRATWGEHFSEIVPPAILQVAQYVGGVAAGAFNPRDELVGFVFGISGIETTSSGIVPVHWSDMLAVRQDMRNQGIGARLKRHQRAVLLERGVQRVYWTFDPLDAKNAFINFARLGVIAREYRNDMYGATDSPLHRGIGTDRLIAIWAIASQRVEQRLTGLHRLPDDAKTKRIDVPLDIHDLNLRDPASARQWRARTRAAFHEWLEQD